MASMLGHLRLLHRLIKLQLFQWLQGLFDHDHLQITSPCKTWLALTIAFPTASWGKVSTMWSSGQCARLANERFRVQFLAGEVTVGKFLYTDCLC